MKFKAYLMLGLAALALSSCDESFNDWANPATNQQEATVSFGNGSITERPVIDLGKVEEDQVQLCQVNAPTANPEEWAKANYQITLNDELTLDMDANGNVDKQAVQDYIVKTYGRAPEERALTAKVVAYVGDGNTATKMVLASSDPFHVKVIPYAPVIEEAYYLVGNLNGWDPSNTDYQLTYVGEDPYEKPDFSITIDVESLNLPADADALYFKVCPQSAVGTDDAWDHMLTSPDGDDTEELSGKYGVAGGAFKIALSKLANYKKVKVNFNMMQGTYEISFINFDEFIYGIGNGTGWSRVCPLRCDNGDGEYYGYIYINGEWKFRSHEDSWDAPDWGGALDTPDALTGTLNEGGNIPAVPTGYYRVKASLNTMTWQLTEQITTIGVIGSFPDNNWGSDVAKLEYNEATGAWEGIVTFPAGVNWKFRANDAWTWNWGGSADALTQDGPDMSLAAGTYFIQLYAFVNGKAHFVATPQ